MIRLVDTNRGWLCYEFTEGKESSEQLGAPRISHVDHVTRLTTFHPMMIHGPMNLPLEIIRLVVGEATRVPAAFDTSFKASILEDLETVTDAIRESMKIKLALCLVSKSFHDIAIEFLYEIVTLRQLQCVNPLIDLLRHKSEPCKPYRGRWCRRLEIAIGEGSDEYRGGMWPEEIHTLWALVYSCPRLVIFLCAVHYNMGMRHRCSLIPIRFRIPRTLFQLIASNCSQTLKRMEIHGDTAIRLDRVELLLKACTVLEVCRIERVDLYDPEWGVYDSPYESDPDECGVELGGVSDVEWDGEAMTESRRARKKVKWPVEPLRQETVLPNLHTLEIYPFCLHPGILTLPSLRCVGYRLDMLRTSEQSKTILDRVLGDTHHRLTHVTYWGPTTMIWDILDRLPNVTELTFGAILNDNTAVVSPHRHLCLSNINLVWSIYCPATTTYFLAAIAKAVSDGLFPSLHDVRVWECRVEIEQAQRDLFSSLGLMLEFTTRFQSRFIKCVQFRLVPLHFR